MSLPRSFLAGKWIGCMRFDLVSETGIRGSVRSAHANSPARFTTSTADFENRPAPLTATVADETHNGIYRRSYDALEVVLMHNQSVGF